MIVITGSDEQKSVKIESILKREEKHFKRNGITCCNLQYESEDSFPLSVRIKMRNTAKQFKSISPIIEMLSQRDAYIVEHSKRVALITYRICMLIQMSGYYRKTIALSAYAHDIGKITLPDSILCRDSELNAAEQERMKQHPIDGAVLLNAQSQYSHIKDGILYHHEYWNGKGYPTGAKEEKIPFPARIIAIADSIDAMMSAKPYGSVLSGTECREEIEKNAGTMYEPQLAGIVADNWNYIIHGIYKSRHTTNNS